MQGKKVRNLYYLAGAVPTPDEAAEAEKLGITAFRNASLVGKENLEKADGVAGAVPEGYLSMKGMRFLGRAAELVKAARAKAAQTPKPEGE